MEAGVSDSRAVHLLVGEVVVILSVDDAARQKPCKDDAREALYGLMHACMRKGKYCTDLRRDGTGNMSDIHGLILSCCGQSSMGTLVFLEWFRK